MNELIITVEKIKGNCSVFKGGEKMVIKGAEIDLKRTDKICIHALAPILHYASALKCGVNPKELGLSKNSKKAYVQCPDPGKPYTSGGSVVFKIELR